jgi:hypothetical protein
MASSSSSPRLNEWKWVQIEDALREVTWQSKNKARLNFALDQFYYRHPSD